MTNRTRIVMLVLIVVVAVVAVYTIRTAPVTTSPSSQHSASSTALALVDAVYPLYSGVSWGEPISRETMLATTSVQVTGVDSVAVTDTMDPGSVFTPFETYYASKLAALGWSEDTSLAAGGPTGGQTVYRKDGAFIFVNFSTVFHNVSSTSPATCPCDVTLSLASSPK